jgi:hypothetical protein
MGTVLAMLLCEKRDSSAAVRKTYVRMWGYDRRQLEEIEQNSEN